MAPAPKRKSNFTSDHFVASDDDSETGRPSKRSKPPKTTFQPTVQSQVDSDGNKYWEISKARRVTISEFKGKSLVNIREYYQKDDQWLPGKKGISMTVEQYSAFVELVPQIETLLQEKGESVPRPDYSGMAAVPSTRDPRDDNNDDEELKKSNIEATSDEED